MFSVVYEGRRGKPYSYTFDNDANGDGRFNDLLYIPANRTMCSLVRLPKRTRSGPSSTATSTCRNHLGEVAERNVTSSGWVNNFDVRLSQELPGFMDGHKARSGSTS